MGVWHPGGLTERHEASKRAPLARIIPRSGAANSQVFEKAVKYPSDWIERRSQMSKNDLVVVTGAGGFIGGHLIRVLQQRGHTKIRGVDNKPLGEWYQKTPGVENQVGDLALLEPCRAAAKGAKMIYNLAADMGGMGFIETHKAECMLSVLVSTHMLVAA